jgi:pimeloyl-ACP methyl ester carboxylesterase
MESFFDFLVRLNNGPYGHIVNIILAFPIALYLALYAVAAFRGASTWWERWAAVFRLVNIGSGGLILINFVVALVIPYNMALSTIKPLRIGGTANAAIVLIHGWNGDDSTWRIFPDLLLSDERLSECDLLLVHYPTFIARRNLTIPQLADWVSRNINISLSNKSIYVVSHSMGGLISRKMFLQRKIAQTSGQIRMLVTIAAPHNGANYSALASAIGVSSELTTDLKRGSSLLEDIKIGWRDYRKNRDRGEARNDCLGSPHDTIVPADSAIDQCDDFSQYPRWGHSEMVQPKELGDERYIVPLAMLRVAELCGKGSRTNGTKE